MFLGAAYPAGCGAAPWGKERSMHLVGIQLQGCGAALASFRVLGSGLRAIANTRIIVPLFRHIFSDHWHLAFSYPETSTPSYCYEYVLSIHIPFVGGLFYRRTDCFSSRTIRSSRLHTSHERKPSPIRLKVQQRLNCETSK
jgi:hypothetical protein